MLTNYKLIRKETNYDTTIYKIVRTKEKEEDSEKVVLVFSIRSFIGCCGTMCIGEFTYNQVNLVKNNEDHKRLIFNIMMRSVPTNHCIFTDNTVVGEDERIYDLIKAVHEEVKVIDFYFNENSGNSVVVYSYTKSKV